MKNKILLILSYIIFIFLLVIVIPIIMINDVILGFKNGIINIINWTKNTVYNINKEYRK